jgi:hypothetical protein
VDALPLSLRDISQGLSREARKSEPTDGGFVTTLGVKLNLPDRSAQDAAKMGLLNFES